MQYFGKKLKKIREDKEMSQTELGKKIGVSGSTISAYEKSRKLPTIETLKKLCLVLEISSDYLLGISDKMELLKTDLTDSQVASLQTIIHDLERLNNNDYAY